MVRHWPHARLTARLTTATCALRHPSRSLVVLRLIPSYTVAIPPNLLRSLLPWSISYLSLCSDAVYPPSLPIIVLTCLLPPSLHHAAGFRIGSPLDCPLAPHTVFQVDTACPSAHCAKPLSEYMAAQCEGHALGEMAYVLDRPGGRAVRYGPGPQRGKSLSIARKTTRLAAQG